MEIIFSTNTKRTVMKAYKYTLIILTMITLSTLVGCSSESSDPIPVDPLTVQRELLINGGNTWVISGTGSVIKDGFNVTGQFAGFTLIIGESTYVTTNGLASAWPASGTWEFDNGNVSKIRRSDGVIMTATVTASTLKLIFTAGGKTGGKLSGVEGEYQFNLVSQ